MPTVFPVKFMMVITFDNLLLYHYETFLFIRGKTLCLKFYFTLTFKNRLLYGISLPSVNFQPIYGFIFIY